MKTNQDRLPIKSLIGEVKPMETQSFGFMAMDSEGQGQYLGRHRRNLLQCTPGRFLHGCYRRKAAARYQHQIFRRT